MAHRTSCDSVDGVSCSAVCEDVVHDQEYRFYLREKLSDCSLNWSDSIGGDPQLIRDYFYRFLYQPRDREYPDLCQLPDLNEDTLMDNLRARFQAGHIYTYVGSILIAVNPFKFYPIYNPKYVKLYQNRRLGELPPHIFAVADAAYHAMLTDRKAQCIVISGMWPMSNIFSISFFFFFFFFFFLFARVRNLAFDDHSLFVWRARLLLALGFQILIKSHFVAR